MAENLVDFLPVAELEVPLRFLETMLWSIFPQVRESLSHFGTNHIPSVTQILEGLDPHHTGPLDRPNKQ